MSNKRTSPSQSAVNVNDVIIVSETLACYLVCLNYTVTSIIPRVGDCLHMSFF